ncbi:MAG: hypothetical protein ACRD2P_17680 [Terriglobia bacterium]
MGALVQADIGALLEQAGAHPRGNRHDCPKCGGLRTVTHSEEVFFCHKCQWKGNVVGLEKELGIYRRIPSAQYREFCRKRERAHEAAARLYVEVHSRRMELLDDLHSLARLEALAHDAGPTEAAWDSLALVYSERPVIEAELDAIESATAQEALELLGSGRGDFEARYPQNSPQPSNGSM